MKKHRNGIILISCILLISLMALGATMTQKPADLNKIKAWGIPSYMVENLNYMINEFNRAFKAKVELFKVELKTRFKEYKDMPDDVIIYLEKGVFLTKEDYLKVRGIDQESNKTIPTKGREK